MNKRLIAIYSIILVIIIGCVWYKMPITMTKTDASDVSYIQVYEKNSNEYYCITDRTDIAYIINNLIM